MNYAIIGLGFIAKRHIDAIKATGGEVLLACDIDKTTWDKVNCPTYENYEKLEEDDRWPDVDCVVVCTPNDIHLLVAQWALERGKTVLCEKPIAISSESLKPFLLSRNLFTVMQLRHHKILPTFPRIVEDAELYVKVKRDEDYWRGWKGIESRSAGILFNLGVHYFDILLRTLGNSYRIVSSYCAEREAYGFIQFPGLKKTVPYRLMISHDSLGQERYIRLNGRKYNFSDKDNLSYEDLHKKVYEELKQGKGTHPIDVLDVMELMEKLNA